MTQTRISLENSDGVLNKSSKQSQEDEKVLNEWEPSVFSKPFFSSWAF